MTRFVVPAELASRYPRRVVGARRHEELWVPAAELVAFCEAFVGPIEVVRGWLGRRFPEMSGWDGALGELSGPDLALVVALVGTAELRGGPLTERS